MKTKVYDTLNMEAVKKGFDFLLQNNNLPHRDLVIPDYITPKMIKKAIKILSKRIEKEKPYYVEVENPIERFNFIRGEV